MDTFFFHVIFIVNGESGQIANKHTKKQTHKETGSKKIRALTTVKWYGQVAQCI